MGIITVQRLSVLQPRSILIVDSLVYGVLLRIGAWLHHQQKLLSKLAECTIFNLLHRRRNPDLNCPLVGYSREFKLIDLLHGIRDDDLIDNPLR